MNQRDIGEAVDPVRAEQTHYIAGPCEFARIEPVSINPAEAAEMRRASN